LDVESWAGTWKSSGCIARIGQAQIWTVHQLRSSPEMWLLRRNRDNWSDLDRHDSAQVPSECTHGQSTVCSVHCAPHTLGYCRPALEVAQWPSLPRARWRWSVPDDVVRRRSQPAFKFIIVMAMKLVSVCAPHEQLILISAPSDDQRVQHLCRLRPVCSFAVDGSCCREVESLECLTTFKLVAPATQEADSVVVGNFHEQSQSATKLAVLPVAGKRNTLRGRVQPWEPPKLYTFKFLMKKICQN
jgi:hypothetical protein